MTRHISPQQRATVSSERANYWYDHRVKPIVQAKHCSVKEAFKIIDRRRVRSAELEEKLAKEIPMTDEEYEEWQEMMDEEEEGSPEAGPF